MMANSNNKISLEFFQISKALKNVHLTPLAGRFTCRQMRIQKKKILILQVKNLKNYSQNITSNGSRKGTFQPN